MNFALDEGEVNGGYTRGDLAELFTRLFFELSDEKVSVAPS